MKLSIPVLTAAVLAAGIGAATDAHACGFFDYREVRPVHVAPVYVPPSDRIAAAEQRLEEEKLAAAGTEVVLAFPAVRNIAVGASPLETRAMRILSLALVRGDGALAGVKGFASTAAADRAANLEWAVGKLRAIDAARNGDPVARADLGEALAKSPAHADESFAILTDLAGRDLVGSAHAYDTLARLRAARGDALGARTAIERCELMTRSPASVCKAPDGRLALGD